MTTDQLTILSICLGLLAVLAMIAVLIVGVICLIRYGKTRKKALLIPGCVILSVILVVLPQAFMAYGPPPSNYTT